MEGSVKVASQGSSPVSNVLGKWSTEDGSISEDGAAPFIARVGSSRSLEDPNKLQEGLSPESDNSALGDQEERSVSSDNSALDDDEERSFSSDSSTSLKKQQNPNRNGLNNSLETSATDEATTDDPSSSSFNEMVKEANAEPSQSIADPMETPRVSGGLKSRISLFNNDHAPSSLPVRKHSFLSPRRTTPKRISAPTSAPNEKTEDAAAFDPASRKSLPDAPLLDSPSQAAVDGDESQEATNDAFETEDAANEESIQEEYIPKADDTDDTEWSPGKTPTVPTSGRSSVHARISSFNKTNEGTQSLPTKNPLFSPRRSPQPKTPTPNQNTSIAAHVSLPEAPLLSSPNSSVVSQEAEAIQLEEESSETSRTEEAKPVESSTNAAEPKLPIRKRSLVDRISKFDRPPSLSSPDTPVISQVAKAIQLEETSETSRTEEGAKPVESSTNAAEPKLLTRKSSLVDRINKFDRPPTFTAGLMMNGLLSPRITTKAKVPLGGNSNGLTHFVSPPTRIEKMPIPVIDEIESSVHDEIESGIIPMTPKPPAEKVPTRPVRKSLIPFIDEKELSVHDEIESNIVPLTPKPAADNVASDDSPKALSPKSVSTLRAYNRPDTFDTPGTQSKRSWKPKREIPVEKNNLLESDKPEQRGLNNLVAQSLDEVAPPEESEHTETPVSPSKLRAYNRPDTFDTPRTQLRRSWKPKREIPVEKNNSESDEPERRGSKNHVPQSLGEFAPAEESEQTETPVPPSKLRAYNRPDTFDSPGTQSSRSWKPKREITVQQINLESDKPGRRGSKDHVPQSLDKFAPVEESEHQTETPVSPSKLRAYNRPDSFDTPETQVIRSWKPKREIPVEQINLENDVTQRESSQTAQEATEDVGPISPNSITPGTQARRGWKPKREIPVEQRSLENGRTKRENSTAQESTEDVGPISPNSTTPGTQARRSWKAKRGVSVEQTSLDNDETKRQNSQTAKESTEGAVPISPNSISKLHAYDRPDMFDSLTMPDKVRRSWKPKRNFSIQHKNEENDDTEEEKSNGISEKDETLSDKAGSGMSQTPSISVEGDEGAIISARLSFKDRRAMFSKVTTPPADLMRIGRPGFLNPKHIKKLVVKPDEREVPEPVNRPVREMLPIVNESQVDTSESNQKSSLDKANVADESVSNRVEKFNNFHDRRNRLRATKSARDLLGQKSASKKNMFKACTAPDEDINGLKPPAFPKDEAEIKIIKVALKKNFVFHDLEEQDMEQFVAAFQQVNFSKGDAIIKQGDVGGYFYVVANGEVSFHVNNKHVGVTGKGNAFGELSLLYTCPRGATVTALTQPTSLFRVDPETFRFLMQSQTKKSGEAKRKLLSDISFLSNLGDEDIMRLYSVMTPLLFCTGDLIVRKGDQGNSFYILQEGRVRVTDIYVGNTSYENVTLEPGDYFGECSLISNEPRPANVVALTKGMAFSIDRGQFEKFLGDFPRLVSKAQDRQRLECIKVLKDADLTSADLDSLVKHIADKDFSSNETIFRQIDEIQAALYIVREGVVRITTEDGSRTEDIGAGGYFGQEQLLADSKGLQDSTCMVSAEYTATVSGDKCTCGILSLEECRAVFDTTSMGDGVFGGGSTELQIKRASIRVSIAANVGLHDLRKDFILGEGQFGEVWLVKADPHGGTQKEEFMQEFALKIQSKDDPVRKNNSIEAIKREMTVIQQLNHPFIIDLVETYECDEFIYMLMEAVKGGELWSVIHQEGEDGNWKSGLTESHTKFYSMILADTLAYMHRQKFIFRDLKPENVLIDTKGYPIIVDFGFAKYCPDKTYTFCGTPNYLAPEIVMNRGHGAGVDHWALGVVTYEMITGENPFYFEDMDQMTLFQAIVQERFYPLPETATPELNKFITGLLEKEPNQRLGSLAGREKDILRHDWFAELDFDKMRNKEAKAPWLPTITD